MSRVDRGLQALPNEIFDEIVLLLEPLPLVRLSSCSAPLRRRIQLDHRLWKILYLRYFVSSSNYQPDMTFANYISQDYPVDAASTRRYCYPWRTEFEDFFSTWKLLRLPFEPIKVGERPGNVEHADPWIGAGDTMRKAHDLDAEYRFQSLSQSRSTQRLVHTIFDQLHYLFSPVHPPSVD